MEPAEIIMERLGAVLKEPQTLGRRVLALCPAHNDTVPSLSVAVEGDKILVRCMAGCPTEAVMKAWGLPWKVLFLRPEDGPQRRIVATYNYRDESRALLYQVVRYEPKTFRMRAPGGLGAQWKWRMEGVRRVLFNLPKILGHPEAGVLFVEGEKNALAAERLGFLGTCIAGGAKADWAVGYSEALRGRDVTIVPDADEPGRLFARRVAGCLLGFVSRLTLLHLYPGNVTDGSDLSDWVAAGGTRKALGDLLASAGHATAARVVGP